jgi:hypothetical protein
MEKISHIVRGSSRVASTDLKSSGAVRPGALTFGRPVGESPQVNDRAETTAARAAGIQNEMNEMRKARSGDHAVADMADQFFMTRIRRPEEEIAAPAAPKGRVSAAVARAKEDASDAMDEISGEQQAGAEESHPQGFVPRGSYVNVKA